MQSTAKRGLIMTGLLLKTLIFIATLGSITIGYVFYNAAMSPNNWVYQGGSASNWKDGGYHGAPGPIVGASLPVLAIGFGVYWLVKRRRRD
jgi:hypothetical protein